jgi:signal transduction histidine kinase
MITAEPPGVSGHRRLPVAGPGLRIAFDAVLAAAVAWLVQNQLESPWEWPIGMLMAVALLFRRRGPAVVMGAVSVLGLIPIAVGIGANAYYLAVIVAMVTVVRHDRSARHVFAAGAAAELLCTLNSLQRGDLPAGGVDGWTRYLAFCGVVAVLWSVPYVVRTRRMYANAVADRSRIEEREREHLTQLSAAEERAAIAREFHDVVAHSLAVMIVQADGASYAIDGDRDKARDAIRTVASTGRDALQDMRRIVDLLRGSHPAEAGDRTQPGLRQLERLIDGGRAAGLQVEVRIDGVPAPLPPTVELTIIRLIQEALTNSLRHAGTGTTVRIRLTFLDHAAVVEVADDGGGRIAPDSMAGNGLTGMRERIALHGGQFAAGPRTGPGWEIKAVLPVRKMP